MGFLQGSKIWEERLSNNAEPLFEFFFISNLIFCSNLIYQETAVMKKMPNANYDVSQATNHIALWDKACD